MINRCRALVQRLHPVIMEDAGLVSVDVNVIMSVGRTCNAAGYVQWRHLLSQSRVIDA